MDKMNTAIILAGGKSSRMGFDKQFLRLGTRLLTDILVEKLQRLFGEIIIVTNKPEEYERYHCRVTEDELMGLGPMGGLHAGLKASSSQYSYIVACDMPCINEDFISYMKQLIDNAGYEAEAVAAKLGQWLEPFNAFYSRALIERIEYFAARGQRKINELVRSSRTIYIEESKAREFSPGWDMFLNINTEEDLKSLDEAVLSRIQL